jgi:hypothetical protein
MIYKLWVSSVQVKLVLVSKLMGGPFSIKKANTNKTGFAWLY